MRFLAALFLLGALAATAQADPFVVDPTTRTIETSKLKIQFDTACPERILHLYYKPFSASIQVNREAPPWEFSGQTIQGMWSYQGWIYAQSTISQSWTVIGQTATALVLRIESQSSYNNVLQPPVRTDYTFFADSSCYEVQRTIRYSQVSETTSLQVYVLRMATSLPVSMWRWRNAAGTLTTGGFCGGGCWTSDWDQQWTQVVGTGIAMTLMYAPESPRPMNVMDDNDAYSASDWSSPITPSQTFTTDVTYRLLIHFTTYPSDIDLADTVYGWFSELPAVGVDSPAPGAAPRLKLMPNPAAGEARVGFVLRAEAAVDLAIYDLAGRRLATLAAGRTAAGPHVARWDGRYADGTPAAAGLYIVRLCGAGSEEARKLVWIR
jgi:hypothetical protein